MATFPSGLFGGRHKTCQVPHRVSQYEVLIQILTACCYVNFHLKIIIKTIWVERVGGSLKWKYVNHNNFGLLHLAESPSSPELPPVPFVGWFPMLLPSPGHRTPLLLCNLTLQFGAGGQKELSSFGPTVSLLTSQNHFSPFCMTSLSYLFSTSR